MNQDPASPDIEAKLPTQDLGLKEELGSESITRFVHRAKDWIPEERVRADVRMTPKGLFIHKDTLFSVMESYSLWLNSVAPQVERPSSARILKRMFKSVSPKLYYLIEPKRVLVGYLIEAIVKSPQNFGLPFYLGSLEDTSRRIHPRDPLLQCIPQLSVTQSPKGVVCKVDLESDPIGTKVIIFSDQQIMLFSEIALRNIELKREFEDAALHSGSLSPKGDSSQREVGPSRDAPPLREVLRVLVSTLFSTRQAPPNQRLLIPDYLKNDRTVRCLTHRSIFFFVKGNNLEAIVDREGANLRPFIRSEIRKLSKNSSRPVKLAIEDLGYFSVRERFNAWKNDPSRDKDKRSYSRQELSGEFTFYGKSYSLELNALYQYVKAIIRTVPEDSGFNPSSGTIMGNASSNKSSRKLSFNWNRFSVVDCIQSLGLNFVLAEQVEYSNIQRFVAPGRLRGCKYRSIGRWIFCISERGEIQACVDRLQGERDHKLLNKPINRRGGRSGSFKGSK